MIDRYPADRALRLSLRAFAWIFVVLIGFLALRLFYFAWPLLHTKGLTFFTSTDWNPALNSFGAAAFIWGTLVSSFWALVIAAPLAIGAALFVTELAPPRFSAVLATLIELLGAIPSVVYGLWGLFVLAPILQDHVQPFLIDHLGWLPFFNGSAYGIGMLAAVTVLSIMILPILTSVLRGVFAATEPSLKEASLALGATRWETLRLAVVRSNYSGIATACLLALARALGETMAVTMLIGNRPQISLSWNDPAQTLAAVIANEYAEASSDTHLSALSAIGFTLLIISYVMQSLIKRIFRREDA
jgi:phosphate transport system permease protein